MIQFQCPCGASTVEAAGEPAMQIYCHCDDCQAASGDPFVARALYPKGTVKIVAGETRSWIYKTNRRTFCANCGVTLTTEPKGDRLIACNASLYPAGAFKPTAHLQCQNAVIPLKDDLPHYRAWSGDLISW